MVTSKITRVRHVANTEARPYELYCDLPDADRRRIIANSDRRLVGAKLHSGVSAK